MHRVRVGRSRIDQLLFLDYRRPFVRVFLLAINAPSRAYLFAFEVNIWHDHVAHDSSNSSI